MDSKMEKYTAKTVTFKNLEDKIVVPAYQRGLVWGEKDKKDFVLALSKGYPFGSVLLYQYEGDYETDRKNSRYSLIDGLQRYSTMREYKKNPGKFWLGKEKDNYENEIENVFKEYQQSVGLKWNAEKKEKVDKWYENLVENNDRAHIKVKDFSEFLPSVSLDSNSELNDMKPDEIVKYLNEMGEKSKEAGDRILDIAVKLDKSIKNFIDLDELNIPTIFFNGDEDELADVFAGLNKSGTKLSKYQVYAAAWSQKRFQLDENDYCSEILKNISDRYEALIDKRDLQIKDYDKDDFLNERKVDLSQLAYGLGKIIVEASPALLKTTGEDLYNEIGFGTLGIMTGVGSNKLSTLIKCFDEIKQKHGQLIDDVIEIVKDINSEFDGLTEKHVGTISERNEYETGLSSTFKFLSYIASLWALEYRGTNRLDKNPQNEMTKTLKNLPIYYILDSLRNSWKGSGDSRLNSYYVVGDSKNKSSESKPKNNYNSQPTSETLKMAFDSYLESEEKSIRFNALTKSLTIIYANLSYPTYFENKQTYDFEHVIAKDFLKGLYRTFDIKGAGIGNALILNSQINQSKQTKNLYETANLDTSSLKNKSTKKKAEEAREEANKILDNENLISNMNYYSEDEFSKINSEIKILNSDNASINEKEKAATELKGAIRGRANKICSDFNERLLHRYAL